MAARAGLEQAFWRRSGIGRYREAGRHPRRLTPAEIAQLKEAIGELQQSGDDYAQAIFEAGTVLVEAGWLNAKTLLEIETGYDVVPPYVLAQLRGYAKQFAFLAISRERKALEASLTSSVMEGESPRLAARRISATFAEGYHVFNRAGEITRRTPTKVWSTLVARTELSRAANMGNLALFKEAQVENVSWMAADGPNTCPECSEADGETVRIGSAFPFVDVESPPAHPNCVCVLTPADEDLGNFTAPDATQQAARTRADAALAAWEGS
ncbi:hypothetical protein EPN42_05670 [bacterium]|nr:MAG: hypothetical protein EPN42_05670 [bacterium]